MTRTLILSAVLATLAIPAAADVNFAINHFNQDENPSQQIAFVDSDAYTTVSTRSGTLGEALEIFNASEDSANDRINLANATVFSSKPAYGADIFAALNAADDGN